MKHRSLFLVLAVAVLAVFLMPNPTYANFCAPQGFVWYDYDCDGIQDPGEPGVPGVIAWIFRCGPDGIPGTADDEGLSFPTTDSSGFYSTYYGGANTNYYVRFDNLPPGVIGFSPQGQGSDDTIDSDANPLTGVTDCGFCGCSISCDTQPYEPLVFDVGLCMDIQETCSLEVIKTCFVAPPSGGDDCQGKVVSMVLEYTGLGCAASNNTQDAKKVSCAGDAAGAEPVDILVVDKKKTGRIYADVTGVSIGGSILAAAVNAGKAEFAGDTRVMIFDSGSGALLEELTFHTSCSQPLNVGDQFGSMTLTELTTTEGGNPALPAPTGVTSECVVTAPGEVVEFTYVVTNTGDTPVTNISVIDDVLGEVTGSPIAALAPLDSVVLVDNGFVSEETTNTVTVVGEAGQAVCRATASATVTVDEPPDEPCTTKVRAMLLRYTGPTILDATVEILAGGKKHAFAVVYSGVDLISGVTILSSASENGWTIDGAVHTNKNELGAKTSILINGVEEKIHTSCSTPFVAGAPAPLDNPKGDPSPNWFVEDFIQK